MKLHLNKITEGIIIGVVVLLLFMFIKKQFGLGDIL